MILRILTTAAVLTGLAACGSSEPASPPPRTAQKPVLCPDLRWTDGPSQRFDARTLVGLERERAERAAARHDCIVRVEWEDGHDATLTADLRLDRIDVAVKDGHVIAVTGIG
jgi:hypothetical protein